MVLLDHWGVTHGEEDLECNQVQFPLPGYLEAKERSTPLMSLTDDSPS